jgi:predicted HD phosphohydrolase
MASGVDALFALFAAYGDSDYVGEAVSQRAHGLQAAALARASGAADAVIAAALLHDIGHMLGLAEPDTYARMGDCGTVAHEGLGGAWLERAGFPAATADLVRRHVDAKRYLCFKDPQYAARLSPASRTTLGFQGGPMGAEEAAAFESDATKDTILAMRSWDEAAKDPTLTVPPLESYRGMLEALVASTQTQTQTQNSAAE